MTLCTDCGNDISTATPAHKPGCSVEWVQPPHKQDDYEAGLKHGEGWLRAKLSAQGIPVALLESGEWVAVPKEQGRFMIGQATVDG